MHIVMTNRLCHVHKMDLRRAKADENIIQTQL